MGIIVQSERDKRTLEWIISQVGIAAAEQACAQLVGGRKRYVSNIAKALGLEPPESVRQPSNEAVRSWLASLKDILRSR